jgi:uncharacterized protein YkwD
MARPATSTTPRGTATRILLTLLAVGALSSGLSACNASQSSLEAFYHLNRERVSRGLRPVNWDDRLADKAEDWARQMADANRLSHSVLTDGVGPGWRYLGENVGQGGSVAAVHAGFMNSKPHRDAILGTQYREAGIGVVERNGVLWIVEVFKG